MRTTTAILAALFLGTLTAAAPAAKPRGPAAVGLMTSPGLTDDLAAAIGARDGHQAGAGHATVARAIAVSYGYGVDLVTVWGAVAVGLTIGPSSGSAPPTGSINGQEVAMMTAQLTGRAASRLYDAMRTSTTDPVPNVKGATRRLSPGRRIECTRFADSTTLCTIDGIVAVSAGL
ncbi:MAG TPA: hypothetical protein VMZ28_08335 [Kofleriaceae bacterium]|nr:hypothetical protein [Kofleriaceae bacterium]